jgi:imidazole glycerol-phosphate synthase subunit HisH
MTSVVVLDYGSGNLRSAARALEAVGADVTVTADPQAVAECDGLVVPGVGAYAACMAGLSAVQGPRMIERRLAGGRPVLGICVGMQVMFDAGLEHGLVTEGLGQWPGEVTRLTAEVLPHMGWNTVTPASDSTLFAGVESERFYFVHSYAARPFTMAPSVMRAPQQTVCEYGDTFLAAVENGPLCATQFHPEKSGPAGLHLLRNWVIAL